MVTKSLTRTKLPMPTSTETFVAAGERYTLYRYDYGSRLSYRQAREMELDNTGKRRMLSPGEGGDISSSPEISSAFKKAMKPGEYTYVRGTEAMNAQSAPCLTRDALEEDFEVNVVSSGSLSPLLIMRDIEE